MMTQEVPEGTQYLVLGLKYNPNPELDGLPSHSVEILGGFDELEHAVLTRDMYADMDTTMESVTITPTVRMKEIPDLDIFLSITVDEDGVTVRGQCVAEDTEPWLREEPDFFEALAYPEDEDEIISLACGWFKNRAGYIPTIMHDISPMARKMLDEKYSD